MSLRARLLALFVALAAVPLVMVGALGYVQSIRALEALLARQTGAIVDDAAQALAEQLARQESDLLLLRENAETQRLYASLGVAGETRARAQADTFLRSAWQQLGAPYRSLELRDRQGATLYRLGDVTRRDAADGPRTVLVRRGVRDVASGTQRGTLVVEASVDALLPRELLERRVGDGGYSVVIDRAAGRVLRHTHTAWLGQPLARLAAAEAWPAAGAALGAVLAAPRGSFTFGRGDSACVASFVSLHEPAWTILATARVAEFASPFERTRSLQLALVLGVTTAITLAFAHLLRRATRSLEDLTRAAERVGRGDLAPCLPPAGVDEVGRLTRAFDIMVGRVRETIAQVEASRQMAVLGEFASQIAHEIRNPLTSVKLNLQGLARDARAGALPAASGASVEICLREIDRLDGVVRAVLDVAHAPPMHRGRCALHVVVAQALGTVAGQAVAQQVAVRAELRAGDDAVRGDAATLHGALLNLLLNALATMPDGGTLTVRSESGDVGGAPGVRLRVIDTGPGVPRHERDRIFRPFHTTRAGGTGLGLPIARRTMEAHGGRLVLAERASDEHGAEFVVELPLDRDDAEAS